MEAIFGDVVSDEDLKKFEDIYNKQVSLGPVSHKAQFEYAWCLIRSTKTSHLKRGVVLLEELFKKVSDEGAKRDYLFYLAIGCSKLKEYERALKYTDAILTVQPGNYQAQELKKHIQNKMKKDGLMGMAIVGGAAAIGVGALAALVGLGVAASKK